MNYYKHTLPNGLRIITTPIANMESATVTIWAGVGSRHETPKINGISHFLEHMVFKGSQKRPTASDIARSVDSLGAEFNAGTSKEWTNFYIKSRVGVIDTAFDVLSDMVLNPIMRQEDIDRERGVIIEEIGMYEDTPTRHIYDLFEQVMFKGSTLGENIAGTREIIRSVNQKDFINYRNKFYHPQNLLVTVAGGVTEKQAIKLAEKYFGHLPKDSIKHKYTDTIKPFKFVQKTPQLLLKNQKREQANLILGFVGNPRGDKTRFAESMLGAILGGGMSSRLFTEIREKRGLAYSVRSSSEHFPDTGFLQVYAGVDPKRAEEAIKVILDQLYGLVSGIYPITDEEMIRSKEYIKGHFALSLEETEVINHFFGEEELIMGKVVTPEEVYAGIDKVTKADVLKVARNMFDKSKLSLAIIGPFKSEDKFAKLLQ